jgi:hypothetical protein
MSKPAFPYIPTAQHPNGDTEWVERLDEQCTGMTLREYYAGQALVGLLASPKLNVQIENDALARLCAAFADALVAAMEER